VAAYTSPPGIGSATITARADNVHGQAYIRFGPCPDVAGLRLRCISVKCPESAGDLTTVTFTWTPVPGARFQWVDLSLYDNGFQDGSYLATGPLVEGQAGLTWPGLIPGFTHYWRVTALMPDGSWVVSETGSFIPCTAQPSGSVSLTEADNGSVVAVSLGSEITVTLDGNPTTGYSWAVAAETGAGLVQIGEPAFSPSSNLLGAGGTYTFRFRAAAGGAAILRLVYYRPFEVGVAPLRTFQIVAVVN
jgi:inhibitor of cysteine peptidase